MSTNNVIPNFAVNTIPYIFPNTTTFLLLLENLEPGKLTYLVNAFRSLITFFDHVKFCFMNLKLTFIEHGYH